MTGSQQYRSTFANAATSRREENPDGLAFEDLPVALLSRGSATTESGLTMSFSTMTTSSGGDERSRRNEMMSWQEEGDKDVKDDLENGPSPTPSNRRRF